MYNITMQLKYYVETLQVVEISFVKSILDIIR